MPVLMADTDDNTFQGQVALGGFGYSAVRVENLGATEYTVVSILTDITGSVNGFADQLLEMEQQTIRACQKSPRSDNILVRLLRFNTSVQEQHGFKPLADINPDTDYKTPVPRGATALYDAMYAGVSATNAYAEQLYNQDFLCNGIVVVITDGGDNDSTAAISLIADEVKKATKGEKLESLVTILVGINTSETIRNPISGNYETVAKVLSHLKDAVGFTHFIDAGDVTPGKLAKLAEFVSQSISSTSQALGTGGPSQAIQTTI